MAFEFFFNFPLLELKIAHKAIVKMNNDISLDGDDLWKDGKLYEDNIEQGFIASTALISAFDGVLNYLVKNSTKFVVSNNRMTNIKNLYKEHRGDHKCYLISKKNIKLKKLINARNGLVHFENYELGYSGGLGQIIVNAENLENIFLKKFMIEHYNNVKNILTEFASLAKMNINFELDTFTCPETGEQFKMIENQSN